MEGKNVLCAVLLLETAMEVYPEGRAEGTLACKDLVVMEGKKWPLVACLVTADTWDGTPLDPE